MPAFDVYTAQRKYTNERVVIKVIKDFKNRPEPYKQCLLVALSQQIHLQQMKKA